ncbi:MAG: hypothetical protein JWQ01_569 [Massilia sp.]|nr:hypothetical protein [Massilia sp.]
MIVTQHPVFWTDKLRQQVTERVGAAPEELVRYVALVNAASGIECAPTAASAAPDLLHDLECAIRGMPPAVVGALQDVLLGVFFAHNLGSSAVTDVVVDENGNTLGSVVALDLDAFVSRRANEWATWKENTPFSRAKSMKLEVQIAQLDDDTRSNAIQFLLLHEFGHVLTAGRRFLPIWWLPPDLMTSTGDYEFLRLGWQISAEKQIVPREEEDFAGREAVSYYGDAQLDDHAMLAIYQGLQRTSFASLYASTNAYDDFAETFATYVHSVLMKRPFRVCIYRGAVVEHETDDFWSSPRSAPKRAFMAQLLSV